ncbi:uncharacterized protein G2W53_044625 [Senna tora]|uniref:Uncharacterized protein n=1 Tax=Senna tora TaxID=362788 RepID=A0A834SDH5_9FABA|nr:uncharacterized protein G2W53_044625 [Senna tora]
MGMTLSDLSRLSPNIITLSSSSPFKEGGLGESPENCHPTKRTPHERITLRRENIYRRDGPLPSNGSLSPRPRPTVARLAPQYPSSCKGCHHSIGLPFEWIGGVAGEWSSDKANTSRMDNPSKGQHIAKGRAVAIKWQPIRATTPNSREVSFCSPENPTPAAGKVAGDGGGGRPWLPVWWWSATGHGQAKNKLEAHTADVAGGMHGT